MEYTDVLISLLTLTVLEIVLGIDNIVFISILSNRVEPALQKRARGLGLLFALLTRVILLFAINWLVGLTEPVITLDALKIALSWRDLILLAGGLFLLVKSVSEIHHKIEGEDGQEEGSGKRMSMSNVIFQIVLLDIVFSFDSILTAVGLAEQVWVMITAVTIAMAVMWAFSSKISGFVNNHPTIKVLALSFLLMIGFLLVVEAFKVHIPKGYVYFAMAFALGVELLNIRMRSNRPTLEQDKKGKGTPKPEGS